MPSLQIERLKSASFSMYLQESKPQLIDKHWGIYRVPDGGMSQSIVLIRNACRLPHVDQQCIMTLSHILSNEVPFVSSYIQVRSLYKRLLNFEALMTGMEGLGRSPADLVP